MDFVADIASHAEVGVLVDAAGNQAGDVPAAEDVGEAGGEAGSRLNSGISSHAAVVAHLKAEDSAEGIEIDVTLEAANIRVEIAHVLRVDEDEGLLRVQADCDDVLDVLVGQVGEFFQVASLLVEVLLVVSHLNDERHVEGLLQVLAEDEG